jgi:hypothetical protein
MSTSPGLTPWAMVDTSLGPPDPVPEFDDPDDPEEPCDPDEPDPNGDAPEFPEAAELAVLEVGCQAVWPMTTPAANTKTASTVATTMVREWRRWGFGGGPTQPDDPAPLQLCPGGGGNPAPDVPALTPGGTAEPGGVAID